MIPDIGILLVFLLITLIFIIAAICLIVRFITSPYPETFRSQDETRYYDVSNDRYETFPSLQDEFAINLSVVVPAYNEEDRLPPMLDECLSYLEDRQKQTPSFEYEVIVVSDGSTDTTVQVAHKYSKQFGTAKVRVLDLSPNRGKGGAVKLGVDSCRGAVILFADADGATTFSEIQKLELSLNLLTGLNYLDSPSDVSSQQAVICGSRAHLEEEAIATRSALRNLLMHGFHWLVWLLAVRSLKDTQCGFKMFTRTAAKNTFKSLHVQRWAFDVELLYIAEDLNIPLVEVAVEWTEVDGSKIVPVWSWLQMGKDLLSIWFKYKIGAWKIIK